MRNPSSSSLLMPTNHKKKSSNGSGSCSNTTTPCCNKVGLKRGPWTPEEDEVLADFIRKEGEGRWRTLPKRAGLLRCGKSCRLRWMNYLRPSVKRGQIAPDEEDLVLRLHRLLGNRWSLIAGRIPGRTDNEIKNYWNTHLSKKLIRQGIDPRTHKPLNPPQPPPITITNHQTPSDPHHNPQRLINIVINQDFDPNRTTHDHLDQHQAANNNAYDDNLNPAAAASATDDVSAIGAIRSKERLLTADNEDEDDVVFSSFLNSLINEDAFEAEHHLHSEHNIALPCDDPPAYGLGVAWDSPLVSATFSQNDPNPKRVDYQNE